MKLINPWVILAVVIFWLISMVGVGAWQNKAGVTKEKAAWQARENKELANANSMIQKLQADARNQENAHAQVLTFVSEKYQKGLTKNEADKNNFIASVRNGTIKLRQPVAPAESSGNSSTSETLPGTSRRDGETRGELQGNSVEFLYDRATLADDITLQLAACQEVVIEDRRLCGQLPQ